MIIYNTISKKRGIYMFSYYSSTIFKREDVLKLGDREEIIVPEGIEEIDDRAFKSCKNLRKITLPNSLKRIGAKAFLKCESLEEIVIPEGVESIGEDCFCECENLQKGKFPNSL